MCSVSSREVLRTINNVIGQSHMWAKCTTKLSWQCRWKKFEVWIQQLWYDVMLLMERLFFGIPISTLKALLRHWGTVGCWKSVEPVFVFDLCKHIYLFAPPSKANWCYWLVHRASSLQCEACSLPVVQGEVKIKGGNVPHSFILLNDCGFLSSLLR